MHKECIIECEKAILLDPGHPKEYYIKPCKGNIDYYYRARAYHLKAQCLEFLFPDDLSLAAE